MLRNNVPVFQSIEMLGEFYEEQHCIASPCFNGLDGVQLLVDLIEISAELCDMNVSRRCSRLLQWSVTRFKHLGFTSSTPSISSNCYKKSFYIRSMLQSRLTNAGRGKLLVRLVRGCLVFSWEDSCRILVLGSAADGPWRWSAPNVLPAVVRSLRMAARLTVWRI
jgi:hypothetical protein